MKIEKVIKESFVVIGKEGSTKDGNGFIQNLWQEMNKNFNEIESFTKKDENGNYIGFWGAMSDFSLSFQPWEDNFSKGLYLAGVECEDVETPKGWSKWIIPSYEYLCVEVENENTFIEVINYMKSNKLPLVGAVHDYSCPITNKNFMFFPIKKFAV